MDVQLSCNMVLEGPWGTEGESANGMIRLELSGSHDSWYRLPAPFLLWK